MKGAGYGDYGSYQGSYGGYGGYGYGGYGYGGYGYGGYGGYGSPYGLGTLPAYQPGNWGSFMPAIGSGINFNADADLSPKQTEALIENQNDMAWAGLGIAAAGQLMDGIGQIVIAGQQLGVAEKHYDVQGDIAEYQQNVALKQLDVQDEAIFAQKDMYDNQLRYEERIARLERSTQTQLARIAEDGKTERARIFTASDAFSVRGRYGYGDPVASYLT